MRRTNYLGIAHAKAHWRGAKTDCTRLTKAEALNLMAALSAAVASSDDDVDITVYYTTKSLNVNVTQSLLVSKEAA